MVTIDASPPTGLGAAAGDGLREEGEEEEVERKKEGGRKEEGGREERWQRRGERNTEK